MLGTNDVKTKYGPPRTTEIGYGLRLIFAVINIQGGGAKAILVTSPPLGNVTSGELASAQWRIPPLVAEYRLLATNCDVPLVGVNAIMDSNTDLKPDKMHLNPAGRQKVADAIWASLQGLAEPVR